MISVNLSIDQLIETIKGLNEEEKVKVKNALDYESDIQISDAKISELVQRKQDFLNGKLNSRPWEDIQKSYELI